MSTSKKPAKTLDEIRLEKRLAVAAWRKLHPRKARQHYISWALKRKGKDYKPRHKGAYYGAFDKNFEKGANKE